MKPRNPVYVGGPALDAPEYPECPICESCFSSQFELDKHLRDQHNIGETEPEDE